MGNAVRWYEFRNPTSPTLFQSGNVKNKTLFYWMGSIAQDKMGNTAVGFSTSSANDFPGITYVGRQPSDLPGKMKKHAGGLTNIGGGSQTGGLSRWGDYSAMSVDPTDDCTFYYTQECLKTSGSFIGVRASTPSSSTAATSPPAAAIAGTDRRTAKRGAPVCFCANPTGYD
jgi:hypothetical protein